MPTHKQAPSDPWPLALIEWIGRALAVVFSVALLSIVGYMLIGGVVGTVGMLLGLDWLSNSAPPIGWLVGAVVGLVSGLGKFSQPIRNRRAAKPTSWPVSARLFRRPPMLELLKTTSLLSVLGGALGVMLSLYLAIVLISVTTSPFVPSGWRPGVHAYQAEEDGLFDRERRIGRMEGGGMKTSFYHPLLGPLIGYTVAPALALGFIAGIGFSFFPDARDSVSRD